MKKINSKDSAWFRARTLKERIAASSENLVYDVELGKKRLKKWKSESTFTDAGLFAQRLAQDGITEAEFAQILGQNIAPIPLKWLREFEQAYENLHASDITNLLANSSLSRHPSFGFLNAISPILAQGIIKLKSGLNNLPNLPDNLRNIHAILLDGLPEQLLFMVNATLVLEMNVSRLQGLLTGNHPQERFSSFIRRLQNPEVQLTLWQEYPVLAKQVLAAINRWVENSLEFIQHLSHDWRNIYDKFQPPVNPGKLVKINRGEGDSHNNGKSVIIITFASGWQLVYKPRSLAVDEHFQNLLLWLNQKGFQPAFRTLQILDQGNYGWVEFVNPQQCHSADAVKRFYQRQGGYLALFYALEATDFHFENLIAAGEHPVLIDLESLFHPRSEILITAADNLDREMVADSVLRVGLLPEVTWGNTQVTTNTGIGWKTPASENQPLTGFSHGAAGFAWALWKLAVISEKPEFQAAATAAINYERSHFDPIASNWLDLRQNEVKNSFMTAWCNGAPGLGLGRLSICGDTPDEIMYKEITTAIQTTIKQGFGNNHCLCHGDLGNIDLLLIANAKLNNPEIAQKIEKIATEILSDIQQNNFRCGVPLGIETPSLMVGLAGIGYGLLRLTYPQLIPSILLLEPPKKPSPSLRLCASA
ncbi:type 2 lanthipeptide synthetase LanM [Nodularia sphaerocarpa]|uniref:type 2 lanthipeptide synthetase LanM n=1 Tax=Nodularia sphaerocarpa TaxID=137816 RepID=UPI001EFA3C5C|nr:type 2 lanthipeptide synthetase LanM [Nodularia sphaerocarpa]MDB9375177.1 type 2 lanthipeptide synthetase LanM [Nodularia sphaerocarpa CS-585]MDB9380533.1 type 2 lanthipeptide synthetase LanM [Nodularia sphaerocarpa CS-585A2]ULP71499.1 hypothetical protein BDGGKGIB_01126 [Nodularia sphaerocarpa UHCC 0038]